MSFVVIVELTSPRSSGWQQDREAAYGPFEHGRDPRIGRLRDMAEAVHGAASVTVLALSPMPEEDA